MEGIAIASDFSISRNDPNSLPLDTWARLLNRRLKCGLSNIPERGNVGGLRRLRQSIGALLRTARGVRATEDQIIVVGGRKEGLNLCANLIVNAGAPVVVESPCLKPMVLLFRRMNLSVLPIAVDRHGIRTDQLPDLRGATVYVTPSSQYPLGVTLSLERRLELLRWAESTGSCIIEDDEGCDFRFRGPPLPSLFALDASQRVVYVRSFALSLGAAVGLGAVVLPMALAAKARALKSMVSDDRSWFEQAAFDDFISEGFLESYTRKMRRRYMKRRDILLKCLKQHLGSGEVLTADSGTHVIWKMPEYLLDAEYVQHRASHGGIRVQCLSSLDVVDFGMDPNSRRYLALGFRALTEAEIDYGISRLASIFLTPHRRAVA